MPLGVDASLATEPDCEELSTPREKIDRHMSNILLLLQDSLRYQGSGNRSANHTAQQWHVLIARPKRNMVSANEFSYSYYHFYHFE